MQAAFGRGLHHSRILINHDSSSREREDLIREPNVHSRICYTFDAFIILRDT
jgi:hypothetical protein